MTRESCKLIAVKERRTRSNLLLYAHVIDERNLKVSTSKVHCAYDQMFYWVIWCFADGKAVVKSTEE